MCWSRCLTLSIGLHICLAWLFGVYLQRSAIPYRVSPSLTILFLPESSVSSRLPSSRPERRGASRPVPSSSPARTEAFPKTLLKTENAPPDRSRPAQLKATQARTSLPSSSASVFSSPKPVSASSSIKPAHYPAPSDASVSGNSLPQPAALHAANKTSPSASPATIGSAPTRDSTIPHSGGVQASNASSLPTSGSEATAGNASSTQTATGSADASSARAARETWQALVLDQLERHKRYPRAAREQHHEGVARVRFSINRHGKVLSSRLEKSSGSPILDQETLDLIRRVNPLPPPPSDVPGDSIEMIAPIRFFLR